MCVVVSHQWHATEKIPEIGEEVYVESSVNSVAFLALFCLVQASNRVVNGGFFFSPAFFWGKKRGALIRFARINGGR